MDLAERFIFRKSINKDEFFNGNIPLDLDDEIVPEGLREALKSENSDEVKSQSQIIIFKNHVVKALSTIELFKGSTDFEQYQSDDDQEIWFPTKPCPNGCNCGKCPIENISSMSLVPNISSKLRTIQKDSFISITDIIPLRNNYGVIIHWSVFHFYGIAGYKVFLDGNLATSVFSPTRTVAFIDHVNMKHPHHFVISIIPNADEKEAFQQHSMRAIYFYDPNNFSH